MKGQKNKQQTTRHEFHLFTIFDYEKEAKYLQEQQQKGWKLTGVTWPGVYHFTACTPADVVYQLDYNEEGLKNREEYLQMFRDCGWEYLFDFVGYSYFRKPVEDMEGTEEIFCDDESRLDMMKRVVWGRLMPLLVIFLCILVPQETTQIAQGRAFTPLSIVFDLIMLWYIGIFLQFVIRYAAFKKKLN